MTLNKNIKHTTGTGLVMGLSSNERGYEFSTEIGKKELKLLIFDAKNNLIDLVNMKDYSVNSNLASVLISGLDEGFSYIYETDGQKVRDVFAKKAFIVQKLGDISSDLVLNSLYVNDFDWGNDSKPKLSYNEIVSYQLHVRGFSKHASSKVANPNKGKFLGIIDKIPYFKELGINQLVLMPAYDFDETDKEDKVNSPLDFTKKPTDVKDRINYWGFKEGFYYTPKLAYSNNDSVSEFKMMVRQLHKEGIEVVMRFYFTDSINQSIILDVLRFWVSDYHVDGFFVMGNNLPVQMIASDLYLRDTKIYTEYAGTFDSGSKCSCNKNFAYASNDFSIAIRKFLKSDENMLSDFLCRQRNNPSDPHVINYITDYKGFTLNDLVSYDYKHNEANEENNNDGDDFNYSWNCGVEGSTKKKSVNELRMKQIKNALIMLIFSQGTPMLLAGDEMLNSQEGNNNPYCQDNEIGWVNWNNNKKSKEIFDFTKLLISLRKNHPILRPEKEFRIMDYAACGFPDLSYHGDSAWTPKLDNYLRHIGIMICGKYARIDRVTEDDFFYIAYNMHWEDHKLALPKLPKNMKWSILISTEEAKQDDSNNLISEEEDYINVCNRSVTVLKSIRI